MKELSTVGVDHDVTTFNKSCGFDVVREVSQPTGSVGGQEIDVLNKFEFYSDLETTCSKLNCVDTVCDMNCFVSGTCDTDTMDCVEIVNNCVEYTANAATCAGVEREINEVHPDIKNDNADWLRVVSPSTHDRELGVFCKLWVIDMQKDGLFELCIVVFVKCLLGTCECVFDIRGATCQLRPCRMFAECMCRGDVDPDWEYLLRGSCFGFRVIDDDCDSSYSCENYLSITRHTIGSEMTVRLETEIEQGLLTVVEKKCICTHALGSVPKGHDDFRAIVDCSSPSGSCVNDHTWSCRTKFSYQSVDSITEFLQEGDHLATVDISNAYRAVNTHPDSRVRQGLAWDFGNGTCFMRDNRLCMGLSSSPFVFSKISDLVVRCLCREGFTQCINYLDDFCMVDREVAACEASQRELIAILRRLGFSISFKKLTPACRITRFLGIEIDSGRMELRLPQDKLEKLQGILHSFIKRRKASKLELQKLGGILAHCCKVVQGGRTFSRRVYDLIASVRSNHHKVRLTEEFRLDVKWWIEFAAAFNGKAKIVAPCGPALSIYSDASLSGFGATHGDDWIAGTFNGTVEVPGLGHHRCGAEDKGCDTDNINVLEMWPVLQGVRRWSSGWKDANVVCITDNTQVLAAINSGRSTNKTTMRWLRLIFWESVRHNFIIKAIYINTKDNVVCDSLSRLSCFKNVARVRDVDTAKRMCCHHIFNC